MTKISVSTNPVPNEDDLTKFALEIQEMGADYLHCDVMDGKFVPAECLNSEKIAYINLKSLIQIDVHLMIENPLKTINQYIAAKPNIITLHLESFSRVETCLQCLTLIRKKHILCGLSIKPNTPLEEIYPYLPFLDLVLIMSVEPGQSGQKFLTESINRISALKNHITKNKYNIRIEVDGGINKSNYKDVSNAGADIIVMGSAFYNEENKKELINLVHKA